MLYYTCNFLGEPPMLFGPEYTKTMKGVVRTKSLFYELSYENQDNVIFTLKNHDMTPEDRNEATQLHGNRVKDHDGGRTYVSFPNLYRSLVPQDPTEYTFAMTVFGDWQVWETIREAPQIKPYITRLRREAEIKIKSEAIKAIAEEAKSGGRSSFTAAKLLLERGWIEKEPASKSKQKLMEKEEQEMDREAMKLLTEEAERLGLNKLN